MKVQAICDHSTRGCIPCEFAVEHTHEDYELPFRMGCPKRPDLRVACVHWNPDNDLEDNDGKV